MPLTRSGLFPRGDSSVVAVALGRCQGDEAADEVEADLGGVLPAGVDGDGVTSTGDLDDLGDVLVGRLQLVGCLCDGPRCLDSAASSCRSGDELRGDA